MDSGPFGLVATGFGAVATVIALTQLILAASSAEKTPRTDAIATLALALATAAFLSGLAGTGLGLKACADAVMGAGPEHREMLWKMGSAISWTTTSVGALWAGFNVVLIALARVVRTR